MQRLPCRLHDDEWYLRRTHHCADVCGAELRSVCGGDSEHVQVLPDGVQAVEGDLRYDQERGLSFSVSGGGTAGDRGIHRGVPSVKE